MVFTPSPMLLKLLYNRGSLHNLPDGQGVAFSIKNRLDTVRLTAIGQVKVGGTVVTAEHITLDLGRGASRGAGPHLCASH
jgi:hydroxymethylglutaryl-CoA reductase (NADPH)